MKDRVYPEAAGGVDDHHSVAVHFLKLLTDYAAARHLPLETLLASAGLRAEDLHDPNGRIPFTRFDQLCQLMAKTLNEPSLGLKLGQSIRPGHLGSHGFALMSCSTGAELMQQHMRYSALNIDAAHVVIEKKGDEYIRYWRSNLEGNAPLGRLQDELNLAITVTLARWFINRDDLNPLWVSFQHARPENTSAYELLFRCPVRFSQKETAVSVSADYLQLPLPHANPQLRRIMDDLCAQLLKQLGESLEPAWLARARKAVLDAFRQGLPDIGEIAASAGMGEDEFKTQLSARGLSFRGFVDDLRQALALGYVRDPDLSLVDIAYLLGFSEQSAFQRAFKRWTGQTPGEYRRR